MIEIMRRIIGNVLTALYQPFGIALIMSVLCMYLYIFATELGWKTLVRWWIDKFKRSEKFRRVFCLIFYLMMILFRTLINREMWANPVSDVIGVWSIYNENGELTTEAIENLALFIPFTVLLLWCFCEKIVGESVKLITILWKSATVIFLFSLSIEFLQLFFRLGTFQLSDLFYNTLGGFVGGLIYWIGYTLFHKNK